VGGGWRVYFGTSFSRRVIACWRIIPIINSIVMMAEPKEETTLLHRFSVMALFASKRKAMEMKKMTDGKSICFSKTKSDVSSGVAIYYIICN